MRRVSAGSELEDSASSRAPDLMYLSEEETSSSSNEVFSAQELFDDWMVSLRLDQRKMLAVILMETFKNRMKLTAKDAAMEAGSVMFYLPKFHCELKEFGPKPKCIAKLIPISLWQSCEK